MRFPGSSVLLLTSSGQPVHIIINMDIHLTGQGQNITGQYSLGIPKAETHADHFTGIGVIGELKEGSLISKGTTSLFL